MNVKTEKFLVSEMERLMTANKKILNRLDNLDEQIGNLEEKLDDAVYDLENRINEVEGAIVYVD